MTAGYISNDFADIILNAVLTRDISDLPTSYFFGLTLEVPLTNNGVGLVEPTAAEYSRVEVVAEDTSWTSAGTRLMVSDIDIVFPQAVTDWGNQKGYVIYDSLLDGTYLGYGLIKPYIITAGIRARLPAGLVAMSLPPL